MYKEHRDDQEVYKLIEIVKVELGVDVLKNSRTRPIPDARRILIKILMDRKWRCTDLAKILNKNHATILHYNKDMDFHLKHDIQLRRMYEQVMKHYKTENLEMYSMTNTELRKELIALKKQNKTLTSEIAKLKTELKQWKEYKDVFKFLKLRQGSTTNSAIINKLKTYLNGNTRYANKNNEVQNLV